MKNQSGGKSALSKQYQKVLSSYCDVCFVSFAKVVPKKIEEGVEILLCSKCNTHVHKCCYNFEPNLTVVNDRISEFLCERCEREDLKGSKCIVCNGNEGAMKPIGEKDVIHVYCGLFHNQIDVTSYYPRINFRKSIHYQEISSTCQICHNRNAQDQCAEESCKRKVHTYCARKMYIKLIEEVDQPHCWNHHISFGNHGNFDLTDEVIPFEVFSQDVDQSLLDFLSLGVELSHSNEIKRAKFKQYLQQLRSRRRTSKKLRRGGFSYILCDRHENVVYCSCFSKDEGDMVLCECCFEWYHQRCLRDNFQDSQQFICSKCRGFYDFKRRVIDEVRFNKGEVLELSKIEMPLKMSVMDFMWMLRLVDKRIAEGQAGKMIKQLGKYPLKSGALDLVIRFNNRNKLGVLVEQCLVQIVSCSQTIKNIKPRAVLGRDERGRPITFLENVDFNRRLKKFVELGGELLHRRRMLDPFITIRTELDFKQNAISDSYEKIIELSKVEQNYEEVSILKEKAQAYSFVTILRKINTQEPILFEELLASIDKAKNVPNLPIYLIQPLNNKLKEVQQTALELQQIIRDQPENVYSIEQHCQMLTKKGVSPPSQYQAYKIQKNFVNELHLYYIKQEALKIDEQRTISEKIDNLLSWEGIKASQQLVEIVNGFSGNAIIWKKIDDVHEKFSRITIEFQIGDSLKRKVCKLQKWMSLMGKALTLGIVNNNEDIKQLVNKWQIMKSKFDSILIEDYTEYCQLESLNQILQKVCNLLSQFQSFPVRIEDEVHRRSLAGQLRVKKDQIDQLNILYNESQMAKNPLSLNKLLSSLPRNNSLVKQYYHLKKQQQNFTSKFNATLSKIHDCIQNFKNDPKKQRKEQIKQNCQKPPIAQITQMIESMKHSKVDMNKQIKQLTKIVNNSLEVASKVKKYCQQRADYQFCNLDQLAVRRKQIQQHRKKILNIAQLSLKSELTELYHLQICNRMRTSLLSPNLQLQKIGTLLKFAEQQGLQHVQTYQTLKDKYETKNQKSKQVSLIKHYEQALVNEAAKDNTSIYANLLAVRKGLNLPQIHDTKTKNQYIDDLVEKNKQLRQKISNMLQQKPNKYEFAQAKNIYLQALKNPFFQPDLNRLSLELSKANELIKKWRDLGKSYNYNHAIFNDYDSCYFIIEEIQSMRKQLKSNHEDLETLKIYVSRFKQQDQYQIEQILEKIEGNKSIRDTQICLDAQLKYLQYWIQMIRYYRDNKAGIIPYQKIKKLLVDSYNLLQKYLKQNADYDQLKSYIIQLEGIIERIKIEAKKGTIASQKYLVDGYLDIEDICLQMDEATDVEDVVLLLKPFNDLGKFRTKNLQRLETRRQQQNLKRNRDKFDDLRVDSDKFITLKLNDSQSEQPKEVSHTVTDNERKKIKDIFLRNIRKNAQLKKYGDCQNEVKMIQNQIFGEWHNDIIKYFEMSEQFEKLFIKLISCPNISGKLIKKKFEFKFIQLLVSNLAKIDQLEQIIVNKIKQEQQQKTLSKMAEQIEQKIIPDKPNVIDMIASGKFDQGVRQDLKKQMKLIKQSKHKKKHKHKKSRSRSPDAKFSSESEKELPSYIQNQYNKEENKLDKKVETIQPIRGSNSPFLYDPEEEQIAQKEIIYVPGTILKFKDCQVEIVLKKRGKLQFNVQLLTQQDHKKILMQLVDPNFNKLSIRKQKSDSQIIPYISKSKKKYKYLVGWFEATNVSDNEYLRDMAIEVNERHKIFGWQNQHIKIHIMSIKQMSQIGKFSPPSKVTSKQVAEYLDQDRMVFAIQYPEKVYQIKDLYPAFTGIQKKQDCVTVSVPTIVSESLHQTDPYYMKYTIPTIFPQPTISKPIFDTSNKNVEYEGWGSEPSSIPIQNPILPTISPPPLNNQMGLTYKYNQIRLQLGFDSFSPILTDQEDTHDRKEVDLAGNLLNQLGDMSKNQNNNQISAKQQPQSYNNNYYGTYNYQAPGRNMAMQNRNYDNRWGYSMTQQPVGQQQQVYNPLNPMTGKFVNPAQNPMYKNPMMPGQPIRGSVNPMTGQYYRPNESYDPRYNNYPQ